MLSAAKHLAPTCTAPVGTTPIGTGPVGTRSFAALRIFLISTLPIQLPHLIDIHGALQAVQLNHESEADRGLPGRDGDDEDREDLPFERRELIRERHEVDVHGVE